VHQIRFPCWGSLHRSPDPIAGLRGTLLLRRREGDGRKWDELSWIRRCYSCLRFTNHMSGSMWQCCDGIYWQITKNQTSSDLWKCYRRNFLFLETSILTKYNSDGSFFINQLDALDRTSTFSVVPRHAVRRTVGQVPSHSIHHVAIFIQCQCFAQ